MALRRKALVLVLLCLAGVVVVGSATATLGALDPGFGSGGTVTTTIGSGGSEVHALAIQSDGKIVAAGETAVASAGDFALARYNVNGTLDTGFGSGGAVTTAVGSLWSLARAVAVQPDGKIVAVGGSYDGSEYEFALVRYNASGSLDTTFGTGGEVVTPIVASGGGEAYAVALQTDGKIVVGGSSGDNRDFVLARYNPDGSLDTGFGASGIVQTAIGVLRALALQPDGKIVAAGGSGFFALARYNSDGSLDASFGTGGTVTTDPIGQGFGNALALQADGKIVVGGTIAISGPFGSSSSFALLRFTADGTLDTQFGTMVSYLTTPSMAASALVQQSDGKVVLAGYYDSNMYGFALARYNGTDGSLDSSFGVSGIVTTPLGANGSVSDAIGLEPDGRIVLGGYTETGSNDPSGEQFVLARYQVTGTLTIGKNGNGSGTVSSNPPGIACGATCTASFADLPVTLTATPAVGSIFTGWAPGGGCPTTGTCQIPMSQDHSITATFSLIPETLSVSKSGSGRGRITSTPAGINCGTTCSHHFDYGTTVTLKATPARGSTFKGWAGACSGTHICNVAMKQAQTATARFGAKPCIVPNVEGKTLKMARRSITRAHCRTGKITHSYSTMKTGHVISQRPRAKKHRRNGAKVNLVISRG